MSDPRSILANEQVRGGLLHALDKINIIQGRPEIEELRDILRVLIDPYHPKSREFMREVWNDQAERKAS